MWTWVSTAFRAASTYLVSLGDPTTRTTEVRLIAFGLFVAMGLILIWVEFWGTNPHHINNVALGTLAGTCGLGALSMRGNQ
jgi:hypothetical protein